jgi:hypothetical protein
VFFEYAEAVIEAALAARMFSVGIGDPVILKKANFVTSGLKDLSIEILIATLQRQSSRSAPA